LTEPIGAYYRPLFLGSIPVETRVKYVFLTAFRNESLILETFLREFVEMTRLAGIEDQVVLNLVDDLSTDNSRDTIERFRANGHGCEVNVISVPTNLGNQGAMFHGLAQIEVDPDDVLITLDCDGEDDVSEARSIIELGRSNPGKMILIERGRRSDSTAFKFFFFAYKLLFRFLTNQRVVPNNFMLIPGRYVPAIRRSPLVSTHLANGVLKLNLPSVVVSRDRRPRYGGRTTQNLSMLVSHGLVGIMVFYEVMVAKVLTLMLGLGVLQGAIIFLGIVSAPKRTLLLWTAAGMSIAAIGFLLCAAIALIFKLIAYHLAAGAALYGSSDRRTNEERG
jgi:glycosyltransferase involved in cell wall biosynthesis